LKGWNKRLAKKYQTSLKERPLNYEKRNQGMFFTHRAGGGHHGGGAGLRFGFRRLT
jgi:hypothetical protein